MVTAIVFAGGSGSRMGAAVPKQFLMLDGKTVLAHTLALFEGHPLVDGVRIVVAPECRERALECARECGLTKLVGITDGGATAQDSIYAGLRAEADGGSPPDSIVLIHDGVRPYVEPQVITANIRAVERYGSAVTYTPCYETIVLSRDGNAVDAMPLRRESYTAQAPQSFRLGDILAAHERIRAREGGYADIVDQATLCWSLGIGVHLVPGNRGNVKITTPEDLISLEALIRARRRANG